MISIILGVPGAGKTTILSKIARKSLKKGKAVYSNCYIEGCYIIDSKEDIGKYLIENAVILIDEGGTEYDNRNWKNLSRRIIRFYKMHRHYKCDVYISSQDYDIDVKLRSLASEIWIVRKSIIPYHIIQRKIISRIDIDDNKKTGQKATEILKTFKYCPALLGGIKFTFAPFYWKYFNSFYKDKLLHKDWKKWTKEDESFYTYDFTKPEVLKSFEVR